MEEMLALEEERVDRMQADLNADAVLSLGKSQSGLKSEDEQVIRRALNREDPSSVVFQESWAAKKVGSQTFPLFVSQFLNNVQSRIRQGSPYGHLVNWDCISVIVKTGADLRQEQLATQMIQTFERIWKDENCQCWVRPYALLFSMSKSLQDRLT